ncbi:MAG: response regulator [Actinomycetota bacterium]
MTGPLTVLVVSDDHSMSSEVAFAFPDDVTVLFAKDAREALQLMRETIPSVVIMDIRTGSAGGYGLSRDMAANDRLRNVPRFILLERRQDSWLAKQAGATLCRVMPIPKDELVEEALTLASEVTISH